MTPQDLQRAMMLARAYERRNGATPLALPAPPARLPRHTPPAITAPQSAGGTVGSSQASPSAPPKPFKRLTPAEMADRRKLGLCYNCDEPYVRGHKCPHLFYLEVTDYIIEEPEEDANEEAAAEPSEPTAFDPEQPMISLHAIAGIRTEDTMQLHITIGNDQFVALLDSGSAHNFVRGDVARRVGLQFAPCPGARVIVANGDHIACRGVARDVGIRIADEIFSIDCYSIPIDTYDMVLSVTFLRTLGPILWDFDDLCMAFWREGRWVFWRGIGSTRHDVQSTRRLNLIRNKPEMLERLLQSYDDVFVEPSGLPPARV